jgi:hypothetical protein
MVAGPAGRLSCGNRGLTPTRGQLRNLALALPEAEEGQHFESASFHVRGKIFATLSQDATMLVLKLAPPIQESALQSWPDAVALPKHWGRFGWTQLRLAAIPAAELTDLVSHAWRQVAPKSLVKTQDRPA